MIHDLEKAGDGVTLTADLCIVGAGAIGIAVALEFLHGPHKVLLLEGGGRHYEPESHALNRSEVVSLPHKSIHDGRGRLLGGTTTMWAGQASPFDPIDFRRRDWVPHSGWPVDHAELKPYFSRAERVMSLPALSYDAASLSPWTGAPAAFDPCKLRTVLSQFSPRRDFRRTYGEDLRRSRSVEVWLHANVVRVAANHSATAVDHLELRFRGGKRGTARARYYLLCCGAIESARLLLSSDDVDPRGLGNGHDLVGRFFAEHIHTRAAPVAATNRARLQRMYTPYYDGRIKRCPKIAAAETLQEQERILNVGGELIHEVPEDSAIEAARLLLRAPRRRDLWPRVPGALRHLARRPYEPALAAIRYFLFAQSAAPLFSRRERRLLSPAVGYFMFAQSSAHRRGPLYLGVQSEQAPNPNSRVTLGTEVDALGMRRAVLDWRLTHLDRRTIEVYVKTVAEEFARLGLGCIDLDTLDLTSLPGRLGPCMAEASHQMGTSRMHDDPRHGVVDRHCRVHGIGNLYIGGASVFPTGGFTNPTINAIALALRTADRLKCLLAAAER